MKVKLFSVVLLTSVFGALYVAINVVSANVGEVVNKPEEEAILMQSEVITSTSSIVSAIKEVQRILDEEFYLTEEIDVSTPSAVEKNISTDVFVVPFYSQFLDISNPSWQGVGCGIASLAMLIDFYSEEIESVDELLDRGIAARAFLSDAGWIHQGLINLASRYNLSGESVSLSDLSLDRAFSKFETVLEEGPVMASVHYTFEPTNPIPHLVVIYDVRDGMVFYNDPAEEEGGGSLSIEKFKRAWKKRYIKIRPI